MQTKETAPKEKNKNRYVEGIGRRKSATARVRIYPSTNKPLKEVAERVENKNHLIQTTNLEVAVNDISLNEYFPQEKNRQVALAPLNLLNVFFKTTAKVEGGGKGAQAEAIRLGLSRALNSLNEKWHIPLKAAGFLTRDPRTVERKKPGLKKARRAPQWSKR